MRVVVDTNILIGGADDESSVAFKIIQEVIADRLQAFATHQTMSENRQMLRKLVRDRDYKTRLEEYFRKLTIVKPYQRLHVVADPEDNKLFESAGACGADYLVSRDQAVLAVEKYHGTQVVTPEEFWATYAGRDNADDRAWQDWSRMIMGN